MNTEYLYTIYEYYVITHKHTHTHTIFCLQKSFHLFPSCIYIYLQCVSWKNGEIWLLCHCSFRLLFSRVACFPLWWHDGTSFRAISYPIWLNQRWIVSPYRSYRRNPRTDDANSSPFAFAFAFWWASRPRRHPTSTTGPSWSDLWCHIIRVCA